MSYTQLIVAADGGPEPEMIAAWQRDHPLEHREWSVSEAAYRAWQRDRLGAFASACGLRGGALQAFLDRIDAWRYTGLFDVFSDIRPALTALKARVLTVAVCSNWDWCPSKRLSVIAVAATPRLATWSLGPGSDGFRWMPISTEPGRCCRSHRSSRRLWRRDAVRHAG